MKELKLTKWIPKLQFVKSQETKGMQLSAYAFLFSINSFQLKLKYYNSYFSISLILSIFLFVRTRNIFKMFYHVCFQIQIP
jgi:hypothetical protein